MTWGGFECYQARKSKYEEITLGLTEMGLTEITLVWGLTEITLVGDITSVEGVKPDKKKMPAIDMMPHPRIPIMPTTM